MQHKNKSKQTHKTYYLEQKVTQEIKNQTPSNKIQKTNFK
jgi:hypothetical protein